MVDICNEMPPILLREWAGQVANVRRHLRHVQKPAVENVPIDKSPNNALCRLTITNFAKCDQHFTAFVEWQPREKIQLVSVCADGLSKLITAKLSNYFSIIFSSLLQPSE